MVPSSLSAACGSSAARSCARANTLVGELASLPSDSFASASLRASGDATAPWSSDIVPLCLRIVRSAHRITPISTSVSAPTMIISTRLPVLSVNAHTATVTPPIHSHVLRLTPPAAGGCGASGAAAPSGASGAAGAASDGAAFLATLILVYTLAGRIQRVARARNGPAQYQGVAE